MASLAGFPYASYGWGMDVLISSLVPWIPDRVASLFINPTPLANHWVDFDFV